MHTITLKQNPIVRNGLYLLQGCLMLVLASWVRIPCYPVPFTGHTLAIMLIGLWQPPKMACASVLCYLGLATMGIPVFAGVARPLWYLGNSAGYLAAFPLAAYLIARLSQRIHPILALIVGQLVIYLFGYLRLLPVFGPYQAWIQGVAIFLPTAILKNIIAFKMR